MNLFDMHSHILQNIDDGAKTIQESVLLLEAHKKQGVCNVCLTPHFYSDELSLDDFMTNRESSIKQLNSLLPEEMKICLGSEVFVTKILFNNENLNRLCYNGKKYMLVEFPYSSKFQGESFDLLEKLLLNYQITPVIAHIERYPALLKNKSTREELLDLGVVFQANASSFFKFPLKTRLLHLIKDGTITLLGTDSHSFTHNIPTDYLKAVDVIKEKLGEQYITAISEQSEKIFNS